MIILISLWNDTYTETRPRKNERGCVYEYQCVKRYWWLYFIPKTCTHRYIDILRYTAATTLLASFRLIFDNILVKNYSKGTHTLKNIPILYVPEIITWQKVFHKQPKTCFEHIYIDIFSCFTYHNHAKSFILMLCSSISYYPISSHFLPLGLFL